MAVISLILIYSLSSFGVALKEFYCCGQLRSITLTLADVEKNNDDRKDKKGCCDTEFQSLKVKDNHVAAEHISAPAIFYSDLYTNFLSFQDSLLPLNIERVTQKFYPPPLYQTPSIYISNCVFRI